MVDVSREVVLTWLAERVPSARIEHVLRVEHMARELAVAHGLDAGKAALAGLLHDLAKYFSAQQLLHIATGEGLEIDDVFAAHPHLLHADASAAIARDTFGVEDAEILDAIRHHTLGAAGMGSLSCVVFLADSLEPGRGDRPPLDTLRALSYQDLTKAVWKTCDDTLQQLMAMQKVIHPRVILTRNWALASVRAAARIDSPSHGSETSSHTPQAPAVDKPYFR